MNASLSPEIQIYVLCGAAFSTLVLLLVFIWKIKFSMTAFIASLNTINSQVWAFLILVTGVITAITFHKAGIAVDIAAGVIGAAVNMFNSLIKPQAPGTQHLEVDSTATPPAGPLPPIVIPPLPPMTPVAPQPEPAKETLP